MLNAHWILSFDKFKKRIFSYWRVKSWNQKLLCVVFWIILFLRWNKNLWFQIIIWYHHSMWSLFNISTWFNQMRKLNININVQSLLCSIRKLMNSFSSKFFEMKLFIIDCWTFTHCIVRKNSSLFNQSFSHMKCFSLFHQFIELNVERNHFNCSFHVSV